MAVELSKGDRVTQYLASPSDTLRRFAFKVSGIFNVRPAGVSASFPDSIMITIGISQKIDATMDAGQTDGKAETLGVRHGQDPQGVWRRGRGMGKGRHPNNLSLRSKVSGQRIWINQNQ